MVVYAAHTNASGTGTTIANDATTINDTDSFGSHGHPGPPGPPGPSDNHVNLKVEVDFTQCEWIPQYNWGQFVTCRDGYVATGWCGSGKDRNCNGNVAKLQCCKLSYAKAFVMVTVNRDFQSYPSTVLIDGSPEYSQNLPKFLTVYGT